MLVARHRGKYLQNYVGRCASPRAASYNCLSRSPRRRRRLDAPSEPANAWLPLISSAVHQSGPMGQVFEPKASRA